LFIKQNQCIIFVIIKKNVMTKRTIIIISSVVAVLGAGLGIYVYIKKKNNDGWKLLKLPSKRKKIVLTRGN
jgi:hypothetical protein